MPEMIVSRITWALFLLSLLFTMLGAQAYALLDHASPAVGSTVQRPPATVSLWFSEQLEPAFSSITVTDQAGRHVDGGDARIDAADKTVLHASLKPLSPGTYNVQWRVVSVDSHATESSFDFRVAG